ncbi:MAG: SRPBCC domain-containing protein [Thermoproteota archaeon]|nr:SRPBCC domain-containing protein [Thermoproteota archaeon]
MKEVRTEIEINSYPESVWKILTDFATYDQWNPFINKIIGNPREGDKIDIHIETPSGKKRRYSPRITKVEEARELRWFGKSSIPGFLNAEHIFTIEELQPQRVRFVQREVFDGLLAGLFGKGMDSDVKQGFEDMNYALKKHAERSNH